MDSTMIIAFDIETVPDTDGGAKLYDLAGLSTEEAAKAMLAARRSKVPDAVMLPLHQHKVVAISVAVRWDRESFVVKSLGNLESTEKEIVADFFRAIEKRPTLVSWNGGSFDLPVLQYRALIHSIRSTPYWDTGDFDRDFKFSNYQSRYHKRHLDIMDILARFQPRSFAALDEIAKLIGLPGKSGIGGANVFEAYLDGKLKEIRDYCEIDALNTYLIFLRYELIRGAISESELSAELAIAHKYLAESQIEHFTEFARDWDESSS